MCKEFQQSEQKVMSGATVETAEFVRRMVKVESNGWGDEAEALRRIARQCKLSFWTLNNLRIGRAKSVSADIRDRIRSAFIEHCREHAARLLHDAGVAAAKENKNVDLDDIENQIRTLAGRLAAAQGETKGKAQ